MARFLFVYGYESPSEWEANSVHGSDDESSCAIWVNAESEAHANEKGREFAAQHVGELFASYPQLQFPGWTACNYAHGIEHRPLDRFSAMALDQLDEINA